MKREVKYVSADGIQWDNKNDCKVYERILLNNKRDYELFDNSLNKNGSVPPFVNAPIIVVLNANFFNKNRDFIITQFNTIFGDSVIVNGLYEYDVNTQIYVKRNGQREEGGDTLSQFVKHMNS